MPHAAASPRADRDRAARRASEPAETVDAGSIDAGSGIWVKRWSLSIAGAVGRVPLAAELTKPGREDGAGDPDPDAGMLPAGIERELRAIRSAITDLRREVRELRAGREESD
jgi:hypothetical protein